MSAARPTWLTRGDGLAIAALVAVVATLAVQWAPLSFWSSDALLYQARVEQIRGASEEEALARVWEGPLAAGFRGGDARRAPGARALDDPNWISHSYDFFDRRLVVPLLAAAIHPIAGTDSLEAIAILGMAAFALLLYVLLRQRFSALASGIAVGLCLAWPPTRWAFLPLTESWGLALVCFALLAALFTMERGGAWLWVWGAAVLVLSFTREFTPVPLAAAGLLVLTLRNRRSIELGATGLAAALPAPLIVGAPLREALAFAFAGNRIPEDSSWDAIADQYLSEIEEGIRGNVEYIFASEPRFLEQALPLLPFTLLILAGIALVLVARADSRTDVFLPLMRGALLGAVAYYLLLPHFTYLRYELVFLPVAAAGIAMGIDLARRWAADPLRQSAAEGGGETPPGGIGP